MHRLRTRELYRDTLRKVVAIESVTLQQGKFERGGQLYGALTPLAVVVSTADGNEIMLVDANNQGLDSLRQDYPGLEDLIARLIS